MTEEHRQPGALAMQEGPRPLPARLDEAAIEVVEHNIQVLESFTQRVLERDVDYGQVRGVPQPFLWEPGAQKIANAFECYARPSILKDEVDERQKLISYIVLQELISRRTGQVVATGLGTCSTREGKYGSRWVGEEEAVELGYDPASLRKRHRENRETGEVWEEVKVPNPDWGDLVNTLLQMAEKRALVAAVQGLPGAASALRKLFEGRRAPPARGKPPPPAPSGGLLSYSQFWAEVRSLGLSPDEVHGLLGVKSLKDWEAQGKTLEEARGLAYAKKGAPKAAAPAQQEPAVAGAGQEPLAPSGAGPTPKPAAPPLRDPASIRNFGQLWTALKEDFGLDRTEAVRLLGYSRQEDMSEPYSELYYRVWAVKGGG